MMAMSEVPRGAFRRDKKTVVVVGDREVDTCGVA